MILDACLAAAVYFEALGEPHAGQVAVAHVVLNRVESSKFPDTTCGVMRQRGQFPWVRKRKMYVPAGHPAWKVASDALLGVSVDPTNGSLYFATPVCNGKRAIKIGKHKFCK